MKTTKKTATAVAQKSTLEILQERSSSAVSAIRNIIASLKSCDTEIDAAQESNRQKIADLTAENKLYDSMKADNERVISNFENLLK